MPNPRTLPSCGALAAIALALAGCGGATGPGRSTRITPNYVDTLDGAYHWPQRAVTVQVAADPGLRGAVDEAVALWQSRTGNLLAVTVADAGDAAISVAQVPAAALGAGVGGATDQTFRGDRSLVRAAVRVRAGLAHDRLVQVVAHELGHAFGIVGHSPDGADLMYAVSHLPGSVTLRDANTLLSIYGESAGRSAAADGGATRTRTTLCPLPDPG